MEEKLEDIVELSRCKKCGEPVYVATEHTLVTRLPLISGLLGRCFGDIVKHRCKLLGK